MLYMVPCKETVSLKVKVVFDFLTTDILLHLPAAAANEATKGGKGKKSAAAKDGAKRGTAVSSTVDVEPVEVVEFTHPLLDPQSEQVDGKVYISGCMTLVNLNLSRELPRCT